MKKLSLLIIFTLLFACSTTPSEKDIQTAIASTAAAKKISSSSSKPTEIPKKTDISHAELGDICFDENDLPIGYYLDKVYKDFSRVEPPNRQVGLEKFYQEWWEAGKLPTIICELFIYETSTYAKSAFPKPYESSSQFELRDYGDEGFGEVSDIGAYSYQYYFRLGRVIVELQIFTYEKIEYSEIDNWISSIYDNLIKYDTK